MSQVGLKDLHFAVLEKDENGEIKYKDVEKLIGGINATINPNVNTQELYADDRLFESEATIGKIDVEIETADLDIKKRAKLTGSKIKDGVLVENVSDTAPYIALGFKSKKSNGKYRYVWLLKGKASPMSEDFSTKTENVEHRTPKISFTFMPRAYDGNWKYTADEDTEGFSNPGNWFDKSQIENGLNTEGRNGEMDNGDEEDNGDGEIE